MKTKKCPFCAEKIQEEAIICKHCKSDLKNVNSNHNDDIALNIDTQVSENNFVSHDIIQPISRKPEFILGLIGGILGIITSSFLVFPVVFLEVLNKDLPKEKIFLVMATLIFSVIATFGAFITKKMANLEV